MSRSTTQRLLPGLVGGLIGTLCCATLALSAEPSLEVVDGRWLTLHELPPRLLAATAPSTMAPETEPLAKATGRFVRRHWHEYGTKIAPISAFVAEQDR